MTTKDKIENDLELFRDLIIRSNDAIFVNDPQTGLFIFVNDAACASLGYDRAELLKLGVMDIETTFPDNFLWQTHVNELRQSGANMLEGIHKRKDGTTFSVETNVSYVALNTREYMVAVVRDITERKKAEAELRESEKRLRTLIGAIPDAVFFKDAAGRHIIANRANEDIYGLSPEMMIGKMVEDLLPPEMAAICRRNDEEVMKNKETVRSEERATDNNGNTHILDTLKVPLYDDNDNATGLVGIARDITERIEAEHMLRASEERFRSMFDDSPASLWEEDFTDIYAYFESLRSSGVGNLRLYFDAHPDEVGKCAEMVRVTAVNKATLIMYHAPDHKVFLNGLSDVFSPESFNAFREELIALYEGAGNFECESVNRTLDGKQINVLLRWSLLPEGPDGRKRALISIVDITGQKLTEEKIRQSEEFIRGILDTVDVGFIVLNRDFRILTANKAYCGQAGVSRDELIGRHCYEVSHKISRPCYEEGEECSVRQVFATGQPHAVTHKHMDHDGHLLFVETKGYPIKDSSGNVTSVIETVNNITERHLLEEERLKTQKLESIGTLAGGIAHDFNNLLQGIFGYISMAKMSIDKRETSLAMLEQAENALHLSVSLTTQLLTFSKGGKPVKKRFSLPPVIENAAKFALSGSRCGYLLDIEPGLRQVDADAGQLGQVLQNIVLNADQAMPRGGTVVITARNAVRPDKEHPQLPKGNYVEISVQDSGIGIPAKYLQNIFDPYFTTKEKGSGLGLATSYSIIRNHGGLINVTSELGKGSTFFIYLPSIEAEQEIKETAAVTPVGRKGKILVMDDEALVRSIAGELIKTLGHEVDLAKHGEAAIEKYQAAMASGKPFDIVILDLTIRGGMGGRDTIQRLRAIDPGVSAIVSSGYSDDAIVAEYEKYGFKARLTKPYRLDDLRAILNNILGH